MTQLNKELVLKELCARQPYGLMCACGKYVGKLKLVCPDGDYCILQNSPYTIETIKPYLRPMSSMTKEEKAMYEGLIIGTDNISYMLDVIDWLNSHHFDYRGLIEKGLALEAPEGMYNLKEK